MSETSLHQVGGKSATGIDGAALAFWSDLTVSGLDGGQKVLALKDSWAQEWPPLFGPFKPVTAPDAIQSKSAGAFAALPATPAGTAAPLGKHVLQVALANDTAAQAMLEFAVGLAESDLVAQTPTPADLVDALPAPSNEAVLAVAKPEPGSDAANAMAFDAALQAALAADARDVLADEAIADPNPAADGSRV
jgi:hypothetical protein